VRRVVPLTMLRTRVGDRLERARDPLSISVVTRPRIASESRALSHPTLLEIASRNFSLDTIE
jgi:hypothetical protein